MGVLHTSVLNICGVFPLKQNTSIKVVYLPTTRKFHPLKCLLINNQSTKVYWITALFILHGKTCICADTPCHYFVFPLLSHYDEELVHQFYQKAANSLQAESNCIPKKAVVT